MNKFISIILIVFVHLIYSVNASTINIKSEFDEPTRRAIYSIVDESIPVSKNQAITICDKNDYHITLKGICTPLTRSKLMMFQEEDKPERFKFEANVNRSHAVMKNLNFEIIGAEILQGPRKQFLVAVIKPLFSHTAYTKKDIDDVLGDVCVHVTLMKAPLNNNNVKEEFYRYINCINNYISMAALKPIGINKTVAEMAYNQSIYRGR